MCREPLALVACGKRPWGGGVSTGGLDVTQESRSDGSRELRVGLPATLPDWPFALWPWPGWSFGHNGHNSGIAK